MGVKAPQCEDEKYLTRQGRPTKENIQDFKEYPIVKYAAQAHYSEDFIYTPFIILHPEYGRIFNLLTSAGCYKHTIFYALYILFLFLFFQLFFMNPVY